MGICDKGVFPFLPPDSDQIGKLLDLDSEEIERKNSVMGRIPRKTRLWSAWLLVVALGVQPVCPPPSCACETEPSRRCGCATAVGTCCCGKLAPESKADCCSSKSKNTTKTSCPCCSDARLPDALAKQPQTPTGGLLPCLFCERVSEVPSRCPVSCQSFDLPTPSHNTRHATLCVWQD